MAKKKSKEVVQIEADPEAVMEDANHQPGPVPYQFTGVARSVIAFNNQGFRNFKIMTLTIENDQVKDIHYSDPYANFEAISRMELINELGIMNLNNTWKSGKVMQK